METALRIVAIGASVLAIVGWSLRHGLKEQVESQKTIMTDAWTHIKANSTGLQELNLQRVACQAKVNAGQEETGRDIKAIKKSIERIEDKIFNGG